MTAAARRAEPGGERLTREDAARAALGMKRLRAWLGLTQKGLGRALGRSGGWVWQRECSGVRLRRGDAGAVAAALGTDYDGLLAAGAPGDEQGNGTK